MKFFPPIVTGPIIIAIGLILSKSAIDNCSTNWPIAFATIVEHIGDISAISSTTGRNYIEEPGLHRTMIGDGLATALASVFGAPANTTYGENTGVLNLSKVYDPFVVRLAALILVLSIGINYSAAGAIAFQIGSITISLSGLAVGALTGIILNAVLPEED